MSMQSENVINTHSEIRIQIAKRFTIDQLIHAEF